MNMLPALSTLLVMLTLGLCMVLALRRGIRRQFGATNAYALWWLPVAIALASQLPTWHAAPLAPAAVVSAVGGLAQQAGTTLTRHAWLPGLLAGAWGAGSVFLLCVMLGRHVRLRRQLRPLPRRLREAIGVTPAQAARMRLHAAGPAVVWSGRSLVLLPADFLERFDAEQRRLVLEHEHNHLQHGDAWWNLLFELLLAALWFHPLMWFARARFRMDQELACDEAVLRRLPAQAGAYARTLFLGTDRAGTPVLAAWLDEPQLKERLNMIRNFPIRKPWRRMGVPVLAALLAGGVLSAQAMGTLGMPQVEHAPTVIPTYRMRIPPTYPKYAIRHQLEGTVVLRVKVGTDGKPLVVEPIPGKTDSVLVEAAIKAARKWRFNPATNANGQPVVAWGKVPIKFSLGKERIEVYQPR